jgi:hypothetical protein
MDYFSSYCESGFFDLNNFENHDMLLIKDDSNEDDRTDELDDNDLDFFKLYDCNEYIFNCTTNSDVFSEVKEKEIIEIENGKDKNENTNVGEKQTPTFTFSTAFSNKSHDFIIEPKKAVAFNYPQNFTNKQQLNTISQQQQHKQQQQQQSKTFSSKTIIKSGPKRLCKNPECFRCPGSYRNQVFCSSYCYTRYKNIKRSNPSARLNKKLVKGREILQSYFDKNIEVFEQKRKEIIKEYMNEKKERLKDESIKKKDIKKKS